MEFASHTGMSVVHSSLCGRKPSGGSKTSWWIGNSEIVSFLLNKVVSARFCFSVLLFYGGVRQVEQ